MKYRNYYSQHLSPAERARAFKEAKEQMAARELGLSNEARSGAIIGGIGGGLIGLGTGIEAGGGPGAAQGGAGANGAAIRRNSGFNVTINNSGTIQGSTTATGVS